LHEPFAQEPEPSTVDTPPFGPTTVPERFQPAWANEALDAINSAAIAAGRIAFIMSHLLEWTGWVAGDRMKMEPSCCARVTNTLSNVTKCKRLKASLVSAGATCHFCSTMKKTHVIVIEDDPEIRSLLASFLGRNEFRVDVADGGAALERLLQLYGDPDMIVLDVMMPGEDGLSICRRIRAHSRVPIIMLTARGEDIDKIIGLEIGADDYMAKPFNPRELVARIRAILRRNEPQESDHRRFLAGLLTVDLDARTVQHESNGAIELTGAEFDLLECFLKNPNRVLTRDQLMDWTRGRRSEATDRTIDVQVSRLRKKLDPGPEPTIKTVRSTGYVFSVTVKEL
jgi:two-component system, OmpR family, response regulator